MPKIPTKILVITDENDIRLSLKASDLHSVIWDFLRETRSIVKHGNDELNADKISHAEWARQKMFDLLDQYDVNIDELA